MTVKLYEQDAYLREFEAVVTACSPRKDGYAICLDRTAFYPEGGGQPGDTGILFIKKCNDASTGSDLSPNGEAKEIFVSDTHEASGEILHYTKEPIQPGTHIQGCIDWEHRFDMMQNHSGEHIVSGLIHAIYGYDNVGFHMGKDFITIDLNGDLTMEDLLQIEDKANAVVYADVPAQIIRVPEEEAADLEFRSKKELHGMVRIVTFPGADTCACCGTHVKHTGEIGLIKLLSVCKFRNGVRIEMLCGRRAFVYLREIWQQNHEISVLLSAKPLMTASYAAKLKEHDTQVTYSLYEMKQKHFEEVAAACSSDDTIIFFEPGLTPDEVRRFAVALMEHHSNICAVFSGDDETGYKYALGQKDGDLRQLTKKMNTALNGRGGGKPFFSQGNVGASEEAIRLFFSENHSPA